MMDLALRLRQIELATRAHRSSAGSSSVFLAIVQWKSQSAFARVSARLWRKSRAEPRESTTTSSTPVFSAARRTGADIYSARFGNHARMVGDTVYQSAQDF